MSPNLKSDAAYLLADQLLMPSNYRSPPCLLRQMIKQDFAGIETI